MIDIFEQILNSPKIIEAISRVYIDMYPCVFTKKTRFLVKLLQLFLANSEFVQRYKPKIDTSYLRKFKPKIKISN